MVLQAEKQMEHMGETCAMKDHDHDLIHELSRRLDDIWRMDQYVANAEGKPELQAFWKQLKSQDQDAINHMREFVAREIEQRCF